MTLLKVKDFSLSINDEIILHNINMEIKAGKVLAIVGESGSGKSMMSSAIINLLPQGAKLKGKILLNNDNLLDKSEREMCLHRMNDLGMIFQEPMTALNPLETIGTQIMEAIKLTNPKIRYKDLLKKAELILERVEMDKNRFPLNTYPHKLSGGQRQRVVIAIALSQNPKLLIADEPTTALDVTTQAKIMKLLMRLVKDYGIGIILVSHDLAVVADLADHIVIMRKGKVVEQGDTKTFFKSMKHSYSKQLFDAAKHKLYEKNITVGSEVLLEVLNLTKEYNLANKKPLKAVNNVSFTLNRGENLGLVGESGCGKSTLARCILGLEKFSKGKIHIAGRPFYGQKELRRCINVVFQDPFGSFNPRHTVERLVAEPFYVLKKPLTTFEKRVKVLRMLKLVGLGDGDLKKYPHEFSGGQRQRIAIARALITEPDIILLDESTSALDVIIRTQILDLLRDLTKKLGISYLFISHDLTTVKNITNRVLVMKDGVIVEEGSTAEIYKNPKHHYTKSLIEASPDITRAIKSKEENNNENTL